MAAVALMATMTQMVQMALGHTSGSSNDPNASIGSTAFPVDVCPPAQTTQMSHMVPMAWPTSMATMGHIVQMASVAAWPANGGHTASSV